jgi:putative tributyrin esterase
VGAHQGTGYEDGVARMRRLLDQMSAEVAVLDPPETADESRLSASATRAASTRRGRRAASRAAAATAAAPVDAPAPVAPPPAPAPPAAAVAAVEEVPFAGPARRRWWRHRWMVPTVTAVAVVVVSAVLWRILGADLQGWVVGLGMDEERGALMGTLLVAGGVVAVAVAIGGAARAARLGGVVTVVAIEVVPFLVRGSRTATTEGLTAHIRLRGWVLQPLGMILLAVLVVSIGAALGQLVRSDLAGLVRAVRRKRGGWVGPTVLLLLALVGVGPAMTAVQDGPISSLYDYATPATGTSHDAGAALAAGGSSVPGTQGGNAPRAGAVDSLPGRLRPGHIESVQVDGRSSLVYVPGDYAAEADRAFPVVYFLHGYPGNADQWVGDGAQLPQVLDQVIGAGELPPVIGVMPDGNGATLSDAEWGNSQRGDRVEDWLVTRVVPEIDQRYRTLGTGFRGVAGLSSGGFGAVNLALRHPDVFRWAASYSGFFTARKDIFGPAAAANSPLLVAAQLPDAARMPLFLGTGNTDRVYVAQQAALAGVLQKLGWQPVHQDLVGGGHGWEAWRLEMVHSLQWLGGLWGSDPGTPPQCRASCNG